MVILLKFVLIIRFFVDINFFSCFFVLHIDWIWESFILGWICWKYLDVVCLFTFIGWFDRINIDLIDACLSFLFSLWFFERLLKIFCLSKKECVFGFLELGLSHHLFLLFFQCFLIRIIFWLLQNSLFCQFEFVLFSIVPGLSKVIKLALAGSSQHFIGLF